jgi:Ser/Thr protein kinase RdoA (MazF antagonist)
MRWVRSLPAPESVADLVRHTYGLDVTGCELVRSLANEVYRVDAGGDSYALKIYRPGGWSVEDVRWEQRLTVRLADLGLTAARCVPRVDGDTAGELSAPEGPRPYALTRWVAGSKPRPPWTDGLYREFGAVVARFHLAGETRAGEAHADGTVPDAPPRRRFDLERTLDHPLRLVLDRLAGRPDDQRMVRDRGEQARRRIADLAARTPGARGLSWGLRHGDVSLDNVHIRDGAATAGGLLLHDFDLAGAGWQAADLATVHDSPHRAAFLAGYADHRAPSPVDVDAIGAFRVAGLISNLAFHLVEKAAVRGSESLADGYVDRELASLRAIGHHPSDRPA